MGREQPMFFDSFRALLAGISFWLGLTLCAGAAEPEMRMSQRKVRDEVHAVVSAQLSALRSGDFAAAYAFASRGIKAQFDVELFAALIRRGYPLLLQPNETDLGVVRDRDGEVAQVTVNLLDRRKRSVVYTYWLVKEADGWRINGVVLDQKPSRGDI